MNKLNKYKLFCEQLNNIKESLEFKILNDVTWKGDKRKERFFVKNGDILSYDKFPINKRYFLYKTNEQEYNLWAVYEYAGEPEYIKTYYGELSEIISELKTDSLLEQKIFNKINKTNCEIFLEKYPQIKDLMLSSIKTDNTLKDYKNFLRKKDKLSDEQLILFGYIPEEVKSPTFGEKTFFKLDWNGVGGYAEVFQYLSDKK